MGFTAQLIAWDPAFCEQLAARGRYVIRFDNRDCGLSTHLDGQPVDPMAVMSASLSGDELPAVPVHACRTWPPTPSACSTTSASSGRTSWARRWAG